MEIQLNNISKRYGYQWIIRECNYHFTAGSIIGISGPNGSGKSTLVKLISSFLSPTSGNIEYKVSDKQVHRNDVYKYLSLVGPYTGLIGEFTMEEQYDFHFKFKEKKDKETFNDFKIWLDLDIHDQKRIMDYSSGMNQRLQLGLALKSLTPLLLLDEPSSFLDGNAKKWFYDKLKLRNTDRTVIIASNDPEDFIQCSVIQTVVTLKTVT